MYCLKIFCFNPASVPHESRPLLRKGVVTLKFFQQLLKSKASKISNEWLMAFLEEHHLSTKLSFISSRRTGYFLPSILCNISSYERNLSDSISAVISPIYIVPQPSTNDAVNSEVASLSRPGYIPTGLFTRLLTALAGVTYGSTVWKIPVDNCFITNVCRNQFEFVVCDTVHVILSEFSQYIRVGRCSHW